MKIHKLWNSGRAEPTGGVRVTLHRPIDQDYDTRTSTDGENGVEATEQTAAGATDTPVQHRCVEGEGQGEWLARDQPAQASLESTVAGVTGLPQEVLWRIVSYCTL